VLEKKLEQIGSSKVGLPQAPDAVHHSQPTIPNPPEQYLAGKQQARELPIAQDRTKYQNSNLPRNPDDFIQGGGRPPRSPNVQMISISD